jgi:hypothetical protein
MMSEGNRGSDVDLSVLYAKSGISNFREFNGGIYYVEEATLSERVFALARSISSDFISYGIKEF